MTTQRDREWQQRLYTEISRLAGKRYTPELNIDLPIVESFDGLARNKYFYSRIRKLFGELRKGKHDVFPRNNAELLGLELINFDYGADELLDYLSQIKEYSVSKIPWDIISASKKRLNDYSWKLQDKIYQIQSGPDNSKKR